MRVARYTTESVTGSMMYRAARSLVASSVGDENTSESSLREHYTGTDLFAFVTFASAFEAATCYGRSKELMLQWWKDCTSLCGKRSIAFRTGVVQNPHTIRACPRIVFHQFHSRCPCRRQHFLTTDHNFTDYRHASGAHDRARVGLTSCISQGRIPFAIASIFLSPIKS